MNRDPRDVFILNKYVWAKSGEQVPFPMNVNEFCGYYKRLHGIERKVENMHVHTIQFEDLVYKYDEMLAKIKDILQLNDTCHSKKKQMFNPERSINNTQLFMKDKYKKEVEIIERELSEFLYEFPYINDADISKSF